MDAIEFTINGRRIVERSVSPTTTLLGYVRNHLGLSGTKEGCAEGDCGACTVAVLDTAAGRWRAVNACLVLLPMVQGKQVVTVEGLAEHGVHHPVQSSLVEALGSQCGYCTPGVVMSMFEACYRDDLAGDDAAWRIDDQMCGNLCRCTGYRPIRDATTQIAGLAPDDRFSQAAATADRQPMDLSYEHGAQVYLTAGSFDALWDALDAHPHARLVSGGTDLSLDVTKRFVEPDRLISLEGIGALSNITRHDDRWVVGAGVDLATLESAAKDDLPAVERMLRFFGSRQIKNRATLGGNLCNASPIGDMAPVLLALGASVELLSRGGARQVAIEEFFLSYRKTALRAGEILASVDIPLPRGALTRAYKVSKRQELDISAVAAGLYVRLDGATIAHARFGFGGMAATPARAKAAEAAVIGRPMEAATFEAAAQALDDDFTPIDDHRGSAWYRRTVAKNLLRGFYAEVSSGADERLPYRPSGTVVCGVTT